MPRDPHTQLATRRIGVDRIGAIGDAIVVNLRRSGSRAPIFADRRDGGGPRLRVVRADCD